MNKVITFAFLMWFIVWLAAVVGILYVGIHYILKYW